ncbi:MAG TPA: glycosyltransferase family 9 protein [Vicinamibacterales bacterium]
MKVLLVRLRLIGDVALTTPLLGALRRQYPEARLAYMVEPAAEPVVRGNPNLNEIIVAPKRRGLARLRDDLSLARRLRRAHYDVAIDLHGGPRSAWLTWASGAPMRIGYTIKGRSWVYTHVVRRAADLTARHSVLNQWDLLEPLGVGAADPAAHPMEMPHDHHAAAFVERPLREAGIETNPLVVIHVSAGNPFRRWPAESFVTLVCDLVRHDPRRRIVLTSGPSEAEAALEIAAEARMKLGRLADAVPDIGEFDLRELRALVDRAAVYIGGDSGPLHVAATTRTPIVALFGPTLADRSMPWRDPQWFAEAVQVDGLSCRPCDQRTCVHGDFRCLAQITPAQVVAAAERAIAEGLGAQGSGVRKMKR